MPSATTASSTAETSTTVEATAARAALNASSKAPIGMAAAPYGMRAWEWTPRMKVAIKMTIVVSAVKASVVVKRRFCY